MDLTEQSKFANQLESCELAVNGTIEETEKLVDKFELPSDRKPKKPIEPKW